MMSLRNALRCALLWSLLLLAGGCGPAGQGQSDEEREPHFLAGKSRASSLDYQGAVESFEKALVVNPQSAAAHFELGCLFEQKITDPAEAIYHYQKYLKLRPAAENADVVKQRILSCKQELARAVNLGPITEKQQRELEKVVDDNKRLTEENAQLKEELVRLRGASGRSSATVDAADASQRSTRSTESTPSATPLVNANPVPSSKLTPTGTGATMAMVSTSARTHTVRAGETPLLIARHYGVKLQALLAANPRLDPRRMRVGEALAIPAQ